MIDQLYTEFVQVKGVDKLPSNLVYSAGDLEFIINVKLSITGNLSYSFS